MRDGWQTIPLRDAAVLHYGKALRESDRAESGHVPVVGSAGTFSWHDEANVLTPSSIVVGRKGTAGSVTWFEGPVWVTDTAYWAEPTVEMELKYLHLALEGANLGSLTAQTGVPGLNRDRAYALPVSLPPLPEQRRIVDLIGAVDDAIEATAMSSRHIRASRDCLVASLQGPLVHLGDLLESIDAGKSPSGVERSPGPGERAVLKVSAIGSEGFRPQEVKVVPAETTLDPRTVVKAGDVLMVRANGVLKRVGVACMARRDHPDLFLSDKTLRLVPRVDRLDSEWLLGVLQTSQARAQLESRTTGSHMRNISQAAIREIAVPAPNLTEQRCCAEALAACASSTGLLARHAAALSSLRTELLATLLSGEHRIPQSYDELIGA